jgi:hypothetical protein
MMNKIHCSQFSGLMLLNQWFALVTKKIREKRGVVYRKIKKFGQDTTGEYLTSLKQFPLSGCVSFHRAESAVETGEAIRYRACPRRACPHRACPLMSLRAPIGAKQSFYRMRWITRIGHVRIGAAHLRHCERSEAIIFSMSLPVHLKNHR